MFLTKQKGVPRVNKLFETPQRENELLKDFESLQQELVERYLEEGSFSSPSVLQLSQELDEYIVAIQKRKIGL